MTANELIALLPEDEKYGYGDQWIQTDIRMVQNAIIRALPRHELDSIIREIEDKPSLRTRLGSDHLTFLKWMADHPNGGVMHDAEVHRNEPISSLLKLYVDKKSGKVSYSRKELQRRYELQSYKDQKRILKAMFDGAKSDRLWACKQLSKDWMPDLGSCLRNEWELNPSLDLARIALRRLPKDYLVSQVEPLRAAGLEMHAICARLGNEDGFPYAVTPELVGPDYYIQTMASLGWVVPLAECRDMVYDFLKRRCRDICESNDEFSFLYELSSHGDSLSDIRPYPEMVRGLGKMGHMDLLKELMGLSVFVAESGASNLKDVSRCVLEYLN